MRLTPDSYSQKGWEVIRGSIAESGFDTELARVEYLNSKVDEFGTLVLKFKNYYSHTIRNFDDNIEHQVILLLAFRQIQLLDATRAVCQIGRPVAAKVLLRSMYDCFIYSILFSLDNINVPQKVAKNGRRGTHSRLELAKAFLESSKASDFRAMSNYVKLHPEDREDFMNIIDDANISDQYGKGKEDWIPFCDLSKLYDHLWPSDKEPLFNAEALPFSRSLWEVTRILCYTERHDDVHLNAKSVLTHEANSGWERNWDAKPLKLALDLSEFTLSAAASGLDYLRIWMVLFHRSNYYKK